MSVPPLDAAEAGHALRLGIDVDASIAHHSRKSGKAVEPMSVDSIASCFGKQLGTMGSAVLLEAELLHGSTQGLVEIVVRYSEHETSLGRQTFFLFQEKPETRLFS